MKPARIPTPSVFRRLAAALFSPVLALVVASGGLCAQADTSTISVNCATNNGSFFYFSSRMNIPFYYGCSFDSLSRLRSDVSFLSGNALSTNMVRVFMSPETIKFASNGVNTYDDYLTAVTPLAANVMVAISPPGNTITTLDDYQGFVETILYHLKSTFTTTNFYIEAVNEPDLAGMDDATYYSYYQRFCIEVKKANDLYPSSPALKLGGPVFSNWNPTRLQAFLANYGNDHTTANLRLDFISYHEYASFKAGAAVSPDNLAQLKNRRSDLESWITASNGVTGRNNIPVSTPAYVSEEGIYAGGNFDCGGYPITDAVVMQAASIATMNYYYVVNGNLRMTPIAWADRIDQHQEKSIFVPQSDQVLSPFGNTVKLLSRLDSTRAAATMSPDPTTTTSGFGVYALPTTKSNQVAALVWNWRHDDTTYTSANITISFTNLPSGFTGHNVHLTRYLIDGTHSNYLNSYASASLYTSDSINNFNVTNYTFSLTNNAVSLIVLDPM